MTPKTQQPPPPQATPIAKPGTHPWRTYGVGFPRRVRAETPLPNQCMIRSPLVRAR